jgi:hypothetical protein
MWWFALSRSISLQKNVFTSMKISKSNRDESRSDEFWVMKLIEDESDIAFDNAVDDLAVMIRDE